MPRTADWVVRIPELIAQLENVDLPVLDRAAIESLFQVRRRRAIQLMGLWGGYQAGRTSLIERTKLIAVLRSTTKTPDFRQQAKRRERIANRIEAMRRHHTAMSVILPVGQDALSSTIRNLPSSVSLVPRMLTVEFDSAEDLLGKLFQVAQAAANDFEGFRAAAE